MSFSNVDTTRLLANMWAGTGIMIPYFQKRSANTPDYGGYVKTPDGRVFAFQGWVKTKFNGRQELIVKVRHVSDDFRWMDKGDKRKFVERVKYDGTITISDKTAYDVTQECWEAQCGGRVETLAGEVWNDRKLCALPPGKRVNRKADKGVAGDEGGDSGGRG